VVLIINSALEVVMNHFAVYEKHWSMDSLEESIFWRLFLLKFLNVGKTNDGRIKGRIGGRKARRKKRMNEGKKEGRQEGRFIMLLLNYDK